MELPLSLTIFLLELPAPCSAASWAWHGPYQVSRMTDKGREGCYQYQRTAGTDGVFALCFAKNRQMCLTGLELIILHRRAVYMCIYVVHICNA